ncbi:MAG: uracil-DNA glycosylase [Paracoccaceae bacterium]
MGAVTGIQANLAVDLATLRWLVELGADEAIGDSPVDRYALPAPVAKTAARKAAGAGAEPVAPAVLHKPAAEPDKADEAVEAASRLAAGCNSLDELRAALAGFEGCALKKGARNTVFADGNPAAPLMIIGEAPGREEDARGLPFVGQAGQMLDRMLAAIGIARDHADVANACYITNLVPWRPPQNRDPSADEAAIMKPFMLRHIALAAPKLLVLLGNVPARGLVGATKGITRLRGTWADLADRPALHMLHPAALLHNPANKRHAWADLLALKDKLEGLDHG